MAKVKIDPLSLGMANIKIERPSPKQAEMYPHIRANVSLELLLRTDVPGGLDVSTSLPLRGLKIYETETGELRLGMPFIPSSKGGRSFFPIGHLGKMREAYLIALYNVKAEEWAKLPPLPQYDDIPLDMEVTPSEDQDEIEMVF